MNRQTEILNVFKQDYDLELKKSEIKKIGGISYYNNTDKHLGDTLSRMVKNGLLVRVKKGVYKLGKRKGKLLIQPKEQTRLFE